VVVVPAAAVAAAVVVAVARTIEKILRATILLVC